MISLISMGGAQVSSVEPRFPAEKMPSRLTSLCLAVAAVTLHRTWTCAYGCTRPSPCTLVDEHIPKGPTGIISLQDSHITCGSEEEDETNKIFTAWNWTTASGCDMEAMRMNYTCNLLDANGNLQENWMSPDYHDRRRGNNEGSVGTLRQSLSWTVNTSDWYKVQCQIGGLYEIDYNGATCALWLQEIELNINCSQPENAGVTTQPPTVILPTVTLHSSITTSQTTATSRTVIPSVLSTTTESESSENSQVTLRIATITTSVIVLVAAISVFVAVNLLSLVRRRSHKASTSKTVDVFMPDYNPVDPAKPPFSDDVVSLTSKIDPLKRLEDEGTTHTVVTIVDIMSEGSSVADLDIDGSDST